MVWAVVSTVFVNKKADNSFTYFISYPMGMLLAIPYIKFDKFKSYLLTCLNVLMFISIIVHVGYNLHIIPVSQFYFNDSLRTVCLFFFAFWDDSMIGFVPFTRFCSIYWEPGMCQIVIMFVLVLFTEDIRRNIFNLKHIIKRYGILILSIILTGSTMGYLVFSAFVAGLLLFTPHVSHNKRLLPIYILVAIGFVAIVASSSVVQNKIGSEDAENYKSTAVRLADNYACMSVALENPFWGLGVKSEELDDALYSEGNITASNGWLFTAAQLGVVYVLVLLFAIGKNLIQMKFCVPFLFPLLILVTTQSNEAMTYFPYMWIYACSFMKKD